MLRKHPQTQRGATLIEVLITLVLLSVGLLGMAGLQALSMQSNHSAYYRSQATFLAYDIGERMRANRSVALAGGYDVDFPESSNTNAETGDLASQEKGKWLNSLADTLPGGTGKVARAGSLITIEVRWDDSRGDIRSKNDQTEEVEVTFKYETQI